MLERAGLLFLQIGLELFGVVFGRRCVNRVVVVTSADVVVSANLRELHIIDPRAALSVAIFLVLLAFEFIF